MLLVAQPFSYASLVYPDGATRYLWLPDGNVGYLAGKHIALFIVALIILGMCSIYSFLLLTWQLIIRCPNWKILKRTIKNPNMYLFMEAYHVPYTPQHRYWTGMLLYARSILYVIAAINVANDAEVQLISIIVILSGVILLKMFIATKIFKNWMIDSLESFFYINIVFFAAFTLYNLSTGSNQDATAYTSVGLSIIATLFIILYHVYEYTSLFSVLCDSKFAEKIKDRFNLGPKQNEIQVKYPSILDDSMCRYNDIVIVNLADICVNSEAEYHDADHGSSSIPHVQNQIQSVLETRL